MLLGRAAAGAAAAAAAALLAAAALALLAAVVLVAHGAGTAGFFRVELVGIARSVCCLAAFRSDFTLFLRIHRCETAVAGVALVVALVAAALIVRCHGCLR